MLVQSRRIVIAIVLIVLVSGLTGLVPKMVEARERPSPRVSLSVFQCPPGMTDATLSSVDCTPMAEAFDVDIISIEGSQPKATVASGQKNGHVVRWELVPSDAEVDNWGLKQTLLPAGSTGYLLQGEHVRLDPTPVYDYRFLTSEDDAQTDLALFVFSSATAGVIIPPSESSAEEAPADEVTSADVSGESTGGQEQTAPDTSDSAQSGTESTETIDPADAPVDTSHAAPAGTSTESETIAQDNIAIRLAADLTSVIIDTVDAGEVVNILSGPIEAGSALWYRVESATDARGWVQAAAFEAVSVASASASSDSTGSTEAATAPATPRFEAGDRAIVVDPPLNLRKAPSPEGEVVATLEEGQLLQIDASAGTTGGSDWYAVTLLPDRDASGYVAGAYLAEIGFLQGETVEVTLDTANIRSQPSTSADATGKLEAGSSGTVMSGPVSADGYDWYLLLTSDNHSGWVAGSLLQLAADPTSAPDGAGQTSTTTVTTSDGFRPGAWVRVVDSPINLRAEPDPDSFAIEALDESDPLVILSGPVSGGGYSWYLVDRNGVQGYAAGEFLGGGFVPGESIQVIDASVYLRTAPGVESDIVWSIDKGEIATVVSPDPLQDGDHTWILVRAETGETGYVATAFIEPAGE